MTPNDCFAVAHHCCNDDQQSNWENDDCRSETPENSVTSCDFMDMPTFSFLFFRKP